MMKRVNKDIKSFSLSGDFHLTLAKSCSGKKCLVGIGYKTGHETPSEM